MRKTLLSVLVFFLVGGMLNAQELSELTKENYEKTKKYILPSEQERSWKEIPWRPSFWRGILDAHKQKKPVLLWAMNGHPLGCT